MPASEDQVNVSAGYRMQQQMMAHSPERGDPGSCTYKEEVLLDMIGQRKYSLRPPEGQFTPYTAFVEQVVCARPSLQQHDHQLDDIGAIRPGSDRIAPPALGRLLMDRKVQCNELARLEIK